ncbi:hypothetical protein [Edaphobacter bradus]|uniref:hypothetical protein n=1 Tax=Edaphobacter bradus TaxID=2259016 RepID=UPI0021DFF939|nr:hypothetical protein [Edaphobacter bradus]
MKKRTAWLIAIAMVGWMSGRALAQGCVAAHSNQRSMNELVKLYDGGSRQGWSIHNLTVDIGYRVFNSNKYFIGDQEVPRPTAVRNHQNIFDIGLEYQLNKQWTLIADVPVFDGTRNQLYSPSGIYQVSGIGDLTLGAQRWIFRAPAENGGNIAVSASVKIPTGIDDATGSALYKGQTVKATADQSMQPGDGGWGFVLGTQGYKNLWRRADLYGQGQYLFNPRDTNGVPTFRKQPGQGVMSVTDQYLYRLGVSQGVPRVRGLALSLGVRGEGVPVRDLLGASDGFRRPGTIISLDPGLMLNVRQTTLSVNGPWALYRNRPPSVPEIENNTPNGDAFFADYTVIVTLSHHF